MDISPHLPGERVWSTCGIISEHLPRGRCGGRKTFEDSAPEREVIDACFNDDQGNPRAELVEMVSQLPWLLVTMCIGPASTFLRGGQRRTALRVGGSWCAEVQDSFGGESRWTTF